MSPNTSTVESWVERAITVTNEYVANLGTSKAEVGATNTYGRKVVSRDTPNPDARLVNANDGNFSGSLVTADPSEAAMHDLNVQSDVIIRPGEVTDQELTATELTILISSENNNADVAFDDSVLFPGSVNVVLTVEPGDFYLIGLTTFNGGATWAAEVQAAQF